MGAFFTKETAEIEKMIELDRKHQREMQQLNEEYGAVFDAILEEHDEGESSH